MAKHNPEQVELTNMCMIEEPVTHKVLVQIRNKKDWDGISFPGGHVKRGESIVESTKREIKEETGLEVENLIPCGMKDWYDFEKEQRYMVFFYKTSTFSGTLLSSCLEGENKWMTIEEILKSNTANDFIEMLDIFLGKKDYTEFFYEDTQDKDEQKRWRKRFY